VEQEVENREIYPKALIALAPESPELFESRDA
jgi:hypothetical protein